jgi:hypothetical protein
MLPGRYTRATVGAIPRVYRDHRTRLAQQYRSYVKAKLASLGSLPLDAHPTLREWGRVAVELDLLGQRLDHARALKKPRKIELHRLGSEARKLRVQLLMLERRLDERADVAHAAVPSSPAALLREIGQ